MDNTGCRKIMISASIWLGSGFASIIIMSLATGISNVIPYFIYFLLPNLVILFTSIIYQGGDILNEIRYVFSKKREFKRMDTSISYGRAAIPISIFIYSAVGLVMAMYWNEQFYRTLLSFLAVGFPWGFVVSGLFRKQYFHHDEF